MKAFLAGLANGGAGPESARPDGAFQGVLVAVDVDEGLVSQVRANRLTLVTSWLHNMLEGRGAVVAAACWL